MKLRNITDRAVVLRDQNNTEYRVSAYSDLTIADSLWTDNTFRRWLSYRTKELIIDFPKTLVQAAPSNPTGTTSTTSKMMGLAGAITPVNSGNIFVHICGDIANTTSGDGAVVDLRYGTSTAPANAAAVTGTVVGGAVTFIAAANNQSVPFTCCGIVSGLTAGTAYWIDLSLKAVTGGTASVAHLSVTAHEF